MAQPNIKLITYKDSAMTAPIYYWVLIVRPTDRVGPPYFNTIADAQLWATQNGYRYKAS